MLPWFGLRPTTSRAIGKICTELLKPGRHRLASDLDAALSQDQVNIPRAEAAIMVLG